MAGAVEVGALGRSYFLRFLFLHFFFLADLAEPLCFFLCFSHFPFCSGLLWEFRLVPGLPLVVSVKGADWLVKV